MKITNSNGLLGIGRSYMRSRDLVQKLRGKKNAAALALKSLIAVGKEEAQKLCAIIDSETTPAEQKNQALTELDRLSKSMVLRVADLADTVNTAADSRPKPLRDEAA